MFVQLNALQCAPESEFTCNNGSCIELEQRCDQAVDCDLDGSDEDNCEIVVYDKSNYKKSSQPKPKNKGKLEVKVGVSINSIDNIQELASNFRIQFDIHVYWNDNRVKFQNLRNDSLSNVVSGEIAKSLWIPSLTFPDSIGTNNVEFDKNSFLYVKKEGNSSVSGLKDIHEEKQYHGNENSLALYKRFQFLHNCHFNLQHYPFDLQNCQMKVITTKYYIML